MGEPIATVGDLAGICGHDGTNWEKVLIDASKRLVVAIASIVASDVQLHGYDGAAWQKLGFVWNYNDVISELVQDVNLDAGTNSLYGTTVPSGEVWVITLLTGYVNSATITDVLVGAEVGGVDVWGLTVYPPTSQQWYGEVGQIILAEGDKPQIRCHAATGGDTMIFRYAGYKMVLDL